MKSKVGRLMVVGAIVSTALLSPVFAWGASSCSFESAVVTVTLIGDLTEATLSVGPGGAIQVDGTQCEDATVHNAESIAIGVDNPAADDDQAVIFDFSGGMFEPGATPEPDEPSEVEISVDLGAGNDTLTLLGSDSKDTWLFSSNGINFHPHGLVLDSDIDFFGIESISASSLGGDDNVHARGWYGRDDVLEIPITIDGGDGRDALGGGSADDLLIGGAGRDDLRGYLGDDELRGSAGSDHLMGGEGDDLLRGGGDPDLLEGGPGVNELNGGTGGDLFIGGPEADLFRGGSGVDQLLYHDATSGVRITNDGVADDGTAGENDNVMTDVEGAQGSRFPDVIDIRAKAGFIRGLNGDDIITARSGSFEINGDRGDDVIKTPGPGNDLILGSYGNDSLYGGAGQDLIAGGVGDDFVRGGTDNDRVYGQDGHDRILGDRGDDIVDGRDGDPDYLDGGSHGKRGDKCLLDGKDRQNRCERFPD